MKALVLKRQESLVVEEITKPLLKKNTAIIKVAYSGICGSDLPRYFSGKVHKFPQILGHEFSGIIEDIETGTHLTKGDKVVVAPLIPCEHCDECISGHPAMCTDYDFMGSRSQGSFSEYLRVPVKNIVKIPDSMDLRHAALVEPLTVGIHGVDRVEVKLGETAMVMGAGTIGLLTLLALLEKGVGNTIVVDINDKKLEKAKELGCTYTINPLKTGLETFFETHALPSLVYETAGSHITQVQAVEYCRKQGSVVFIGTCTQDVTFKPQTFEKILRNELRLTGSWMSYSAPFPGYEWTRAIQMIARNPQKIEALISSVHSIEALGKPFDIMVAPNNEVVKVLYQLDKEQ